MTDEQWRFEVCERLGLCCAAGKTWTVDEFCEFFNELVQREVDYEKFGR